MIPPSFSFPFGRPSPRLSEVDLARLITRTIQAAAAAHHEQGWAAVSIGCDGRKRTTMFDGSVCQTEGEVCIATRQDGISACIDAPTQGNGLTSQSIVFKAAACSPVTGWYVLDDDGYLYKIPAALLVPVSYWPEAALAGEPRYDLVRSGTWARLMCAAPLTDPTLNSEGGSVWAEVSWTGESSDTIQLFYGRLGGALTHLITVPSVTAGTYQVTVSAVSGRWLGGFKEKLTSTVVSLDTQAGNGLFLTAGTEYRALVYANRGTSSVTIGVVKGNRAATGAGALPANPQPLDYIPLAEVTVPYGGAVVSTAVGTTVPLNWDTVRPLGGPYGMLKGILIRDADAPNAGARHLEITLPSAGTGVVSGDVRVGFGYPFAMEFLTENYDTGAPFGFNDVPTAEELAARDDYDMAFVYGPARLAIEYGPYHLNLDGPDIETPDVLEELLSFDTIETARDVTANLIQLPSGEVALSRALTAGGTPVVPQTFARYRVRPAPDTAPSVVTSQQSWSEWGTDPNVWVAYPYGISIRDWAPSDTTVRLAAGWGNWQHGRSLPCVVWQQNGAVAHWSLDPNAKTATLGEPTGDTAPIVFTSGTWPTLDVAATSKLDFLGPYLAVCYGWTFTVDGIESALSPLTDLVYVNPTTHTYTRTVTVPLGPDGTTERTIYRFAYDREPLGHLVSTTWRYRSPWDLRTERAGAVYDRMMCAVASLSDNVTTEWIDDQTVLSFSGTRPPVPFIGPVGSGITMDTTRRVYALPPLNL